MSPDLIGGINRDLENGLRQGKTLLSEAQLEYAASGLGGELGYPWGEKVPDCADAGLAPTTS